MALIGLLPGTFDPTHRGHMALAQAARAAGRLDEVWLLVDAYPVRKSNVLSFEQRFAMATLATRDAEGVSATAVPAGLRQLPHTMKGFAQLTAARPGDRFVMIVGLDTLSQLDTWDDYERVVRTVAFLAAHRPGVAPTVVSELRQRLGELGARLDVRTFELAGYNEASSTAVRQELMQAGRQFGAAAGRRVRPKALPVSVFAYIERHDLYR
jgi:nicotinate-nucleotide adenylyltransferase